MKKILRPMMPIFIFLVGALAKAQVANPQGLVTCGNTDLGQPDCTWGALMDTIQRVFSFALVNIAIPIAVIMVVWGGLTMATSAGNEGKFKKGREILTGTVVGLVIVFAAWIIVNTVLKFLGLPAQQ